MNPFLAVVVAYLLGAIPFGYLLVRLTTGADVRRSGSGNIGATNVLRTTGRAAGVATLLLDIAKGYAAVWIAGRLTQGDALWMALAALAVMAGHAFPVFLGFKGGKAVASFVGAFLCLTPLALGCALIVFACIVGWSRFISLGSICAAVTFPLAVWIVARAPLPVFIASIVAAGFVIVRHRENIERLHDGTENRFRFGASGAR
jgi:acyl phosphate:glycerol-3-phosphate acyltransferase